MYPEGSPAAMPKHHTRFGKGNRMSHGKKPRGRAFKQGHVSAKSKGSKGKESSGGETAGNGGRFKPGSQGRGLHGSGTAIADEPDECNKPDTSTSEGDTGAASTGAEQGQAQKPKP